MHIVDRWVGHAGRLDAQALSVLYHPAATLEGPLQATGQDEIRHQLGRAMSKLRSIRMKAGSASEEAGRFRFTTMVESALGSWTVDHVLDMEGDRIALHRLALA